MLCFGSALALLSVKHAHEHAEHAQRPRLHQHIDRPTWLKHVAAYLHQQEERGCSKACWLTMQNVEADNARNLIVNATGRPAVNRALGGGSDGEGVDALLAFFYESWTGKRHHIAGISLELGGLDGVTESQTLKLEEEAGFRRVVIEADVSRRKQRFVPLRFDFADLGSRYAWAIANPDRCQEIARQSTQYMQQFRDQKRERSLMQAVVDFYVRYDSAPPLTSNASLPSCHLDPPKPEFRRANAHQPGPTRSE